MSEWRIINADVLDGLAQLDEQSVQCVVTSPPYWGLRNYGVDGQLGLEAVPDCLGWATGAPCGECYICRMVSVFKAVWRVLRNDGTCWVNMGDSYSGFSNSGGPGKRGSGGMPYRIEGLQPKRANGVKAKDMMMIPARLALALQADGWTLRSDIIWAKNNGMPESVTDRPSKSHEHIYLLTKKARYYFDAEAIKQKNRSGPSDMKKMLTGYDRIGGKNKGLDDPLVNANKDTNIGHRAGVGDGQGANLRDVWQMSTHGFPGAHFATFPMELPARCIKAGTSERGQCPTCGKPWRREVEKTFVLQGDVSPDRAVKGAFNQKPMDASNHWDGVPRGTNETRTIGWSPQCSCGGEPVPQTVLDPFSGAGTTVLAANLLGRRGIGIELNPEYVAMSEKRIRDGYGATEEQLQGDGAKSVQMRMFS